MSRADGTNARALGTNPRAKGLSPRQLGVSLRALGLSPKQWRAMSDDEKRARASAIKGAAKIVRKRGK